MDYEITPEAIIETAIDATFVQRGMLASRHRDAVMKALDDGGYSIVPKDEIKKFRTALQHIADLPLTDHPIIKKDRPARLRARNIAITALGGQGKPYR